MTKGDHFCQGQDCPEVRVINARLGQLEKFCDEFRDTMEEIRRTLIEQTERLKAGSERFQELDKNIRCNKKELKSCQIEMASIKQEIEHLGSGEQKPRTLKEDPRAQAVAAGGGVYLVLEILRQVWDYFNSVGGGAH